MMTEEEERYIDSQRVVSTPSFLMGTYPEQEAKADKGKLEIRLVPPQIIRDIAEVRMYGTEKYHDPENWKRVELHRYVDALLRHTLLYIEDPNGVDAESGISHYKHMACNMAFICELEKKKREQRV